MINTEIRKISKKKDDRGTKILVKKELWKKHGRDKNGEMRLKITKLKIKKKIQERREKLTTEQEDETEQKQIKRKRKRQREGGVVERH